MPIAHMLVIVGVALLSAVAGVAVGIRSERRRVAETLTADAQAFLDQRATF